MVAARGGTGLNVLLLFSEIKLISSVFLIGVTETVGQFTNAHEMGWACIPDESIALSDSFHLSANRIKAAFLLILSIGSESPMLHTLVQGGGNGGDLQNRVNRNWYIYSPSYL